MAHTPGEAAANIESVLEVTPQEEEHSPKDMRRYVFLVAIGILATTLGQMQSIGDLPIKFLLKNKLGMTPEATAGFVALASFAWNLKPLAGLISDSFPLFGTRRRSYLILSSLLSGLFWLLMTLFANNYNGLLVTAIIMNVMLVFSSTATGGLLVETSQRYKAAGRISSLRLVIINLTSIIGGPLGGWLAKRAFGWTTTSAAILMFSLTIVTYLYLHEPPNSRRNTQVWREAGQQLKRLALSRPVIGAALFAFLIGIAPGFGTTLIYYSQDRLKFDEEFIGQLFAYGGIAGLFGAALYGALCKRMSLRSLTVIGIVVGALSTLPFLYYSTPLSAKIIFAASGFGGTLALLPQFDISARATPKGCEALGYSLLMSVANIAASISDVSGTYLYHHYNMTFKNLVWLNAGTTLLVLVMIPFLPRVLMDSHDGDTVS